MPKILIIEDETVLSSVLSKKLLNEGYEVVLAGNGEEGLKKMKEEKPDLVLLDIVMPKMDGFEVMKKANKDARLKSIPIIIISNSGQAVEIDKAIKLGAKDYLVKAIFDPQEVINKVEKYLGIIKNKENEKEKESSLGSSEEKKSRGTSADKNGNKILIIEDDKFLRDLIVRKLKSEGFDILEAIDGNEGLKKIQEEKINLVLLDLILPGIDGFEVLKKMKENSLATKIPVIILSNLGQRDDVERGLKLGAQDYLIKAHFTPQEIVDKIKGLLKK